MSNLEFLRDKAKYYDLEAEHLGNNTLKIYSPKFVFDSWLITEADSDMELWHMSKKHNLKKCSYHLHAVVPKHKKLQLLQKIQSHNQYVAFHKRYNKINLVDRVLSSHKIER